MSTPVTIRQAAVEDAQTIAEVHVHSWQWAYRGLLPDHYLEGLSISERADAHRQRIAVLVVAGLVLFAWSAWIGRSVGSVASLVLAAVASATLAWQIWSAARQINSCDYHESCVLVLGTAQAVITAAELLAILLVASCLFAVLFRMLRLAK